LIEAIELHDLLERPLKPLGQQLDVSHVDVSTRTLRISKCVLESSETTAFDNFAKSAQNFPLSGTYPRDGRVLHSREGTARRQEALLLPML
jgi:hypothetical protein